MKTLEGPIGVLSVAGMYRSGKSYLLNRMILGLTGRNRGFDVGHTINACTKVSEVLRRHLFVTSAKNTRSSFHFLTSILMLNMKFCCNRECGFGASQLTASPPMASPSRCLCWTLRASVPLMRSKITMCEFSRWQSSSHLSSSITASNRLTRLN